MMSFNRKSPPFPGPAVLLALVVLMLGAGLVLSGCSDDSAPAPAPAPAPTPTPAPPDPAPTLGAPAGLKVAATGAEYIEFSWEAVEGATGYEIQLSMTAGDFSTVSTATVTGTMHKFTVQPETTAYARVRATAAGVRSDWSDTATGTSLAAPLMLGVPTPTVSSTGPDHIEWSWRAVADAQGYQVQVADSEDGLAAATMVPTTMTRHRVTAEPETTMYIRVRAAVLTPTPAAGEWSAAVSGMSAVAPTTLSVSMAPPDAAADSACSGQVFCPDNGTDPDSARAMANRRLMVTASHSAEMSAMFDDTLNPLGLDEGDNTPFTYTDWYALQNDIVNDGVTFRFERVTRGAGQEPAAASGEVLYITCSPFRCSEASDEVPAKPEITIADSAACTGFEAEFTLNVGAVRNGTPHINMNGLDLGWTYTATGPATVTHVIAGAAGLRVTGTAISGRTSREIELSSTRNETRRVNVFGGRIESVHYNSGANNYGVQNLRMTRAGAIRNGRDACFHESDPAFVAARAPEHNNDPIRGGGGGWKADAWSVDWGTYSLFGDAGTTFNVQRPNGCFRIIVDDTTGCSNKRGTNCRGVTHANYLEGYSLEIQPQASVTWAGSRVNWPEDDDPFEDLDCAGVTVDAADQVDVCELFEEEVDRYWGQGRVADVGERSDFGTGSAEWRLRPIIADNLYEATRTLIALQVARNAPAPAGLRGADDNTHNARYIARPLRSRFLSLWLSDTETTAFTTRDADRLHTDLGMDRTRLDRDLYYPGPNHAFQEWLNLEPFGIGVESSAAAVYNIGDDGGSTTGEAAQRGIITFPLFDDEHHKLKGDFGKTDFNNDGIANNFASDFWKRDQDCDATDGGDRPCDVDGVSFDGEVTFVMSRDSMKCAQTREVSVTCDWDADGDRRRYTNFNVENADKFIECRSN